MYNAMLKVFVEVADRGSFTKAAESLYISSTAIMKQMNILEEHIGLQLLIRTPRGIQLTEAGKSVYKDAKFMIQYSEEAIDRAYQAEAINRQTIRVGTSALYPCKNLMDLWGRISDEYPEFRLKVIPFEDTNTGSAYRDIGKKYDLITGIYDPAAAGGLCRFLELGNRRFCLAMSKKHRLSKKESISIPDLYGETLMIMKPGNSPINDKIRQDIEKGHPQIALADAPHYYDIEVFNYCEENDYILLTLDGWNDIHPSLVNILFEVPYSIPYGIVYSTEPSKGTKRFLEIVSSILQN